MKIGFLSQPFDVVDPPVDGRYSIPVLTFNFARELAERGHDVTVYATSERASPGRSREIDQRTMPRMVYISRPRRLRRLAMGVLRHLSRLRRVKLPFMVTWWFDPLYAIQAALDARSRGLDVIHIQNFSQYPGLFKAICPGIRIVLHMHCEWLNQIEAATVRARLRKVDRILCTSDYIRCCAGRKLPEFASRMHTLYNGVDIARFSPAAAHESASICFIGRVSPDKGIHVLIEAFERVLELIPDATLLLAGAPDMLGKDLLEAYDDPVLHDSVEQFYQHGSDLACVRKWREMLARRGGHHVRFLGELSHSELIRHLSGAALLVQSSLIQEAFGMPVAEAMAMGLPVVATDAGALPEVVVHGVTGLIVARDSAEAMASAMIDLLLSPTKRHAMGAAGRRRVLARFAFGHLVLQLEEHYTALMGPPTPITRGSAAEPALPSRPSLP